jgi:hypothetical protein
MQLDRCTVLFVHLISCLIALRLLLAVAGL